MSEEYFSLRLYHPGFTHQFVLGDQLRVRVRTALLEGSLREPGPSRSHSRQVLRGQLTLPPYPHSGQTCHLASSGGYQLPKLCLILKSPPTTRLCPVVAGSGSRKDQDQPNKQVLSFQSSGEERGRRARQRVLNADSLPSTGQVAPG